MKTTTTDTQAAVIEVRDLVKEYGASTARSSRDVEGAARSATAVRAVDGLSLSVERGASLGLLGPNGAGKTTTIKILSTLARATAGHVRVLGQDPAIAGAAIRARIGVVPQEIALYDALSGRENLEFFGRVHGLDENRLRARVDWALSSAGLVDRARDRVEVYSGGMKRRLNIVAAVLHEPDLVFLDEPTVGIDPQSRLNVYALVDELRAAGTTIVYTTHQLGEVERLCDRIVILDHGRAVAQGSLAELQARVRADRPRAQTLAVGAQVERAHRILVANGIQARIEEESIGMEEVFLALTGRALRDVE